jgi:hypothetical protein
MVAQLGGERPALLAGDHSRAIKMDKTWQGIRHKLSCRHRPVDTGHEAPRGLFVEAGKEALHARQQLVKNRPHLSSRFLDGASDGGPICAGASLV